MIFKNGVYDNIENITNGKVCKSCDFLTNTID